MEAVKNITANIQQNEQTQKSLQSQPTSTTTIPREQHAALFALINKVRLLHGWTPKTAQELDATIRTWAEIISHYQIPIEHYHTLYWRAFDVRQTQLNRGGQVPDFDATLMVSQWTGVNGLQRELREIQVKQGRTLTATAESQCKKCHGSGWATVGEGRNAPVTKCIH